MHNIKKLWDVSKAIFIRKCITPFKKKKNLKKTIKLLSCVIKKEHHNQCKEGRK